MQAENTMTKSNSRSIGANLLDEDAAQSAFRRRNKILILVLLFLIILLVVVLAVLITYFVRHYHEQSTHGSDFNYAVKAYCRVSSDYHSCLTSFAHKFTTESSVNPSQIFTYSLQTSADKLKNFILFLSNVADPHKSAVDFVNTCSNSSIEALKQISRTLATMRANPFVEAQSDEQRSEILKWMNSTAENLDSCLVEVEKVNSESESTEAAMAMATATVDEVKEEVDKGMSFVRRYGVVLQTVERYAGLEKYGGTDMEMLFGIAMVGLQLLFMFFLFCCFFRIR